MNALKQGLIDYFQKVCSPIGNVETGISNIILLSKLYTYHCHYDVQERKIEFNEDRIDWIKRVKWNEYTDPNSFSYGEAQSESLLLSLPEKLSEAQQALSLPESLLISLVFTHRYGLPAGQQLFSSCYPFYSRKRHQ